MQEREIGELLFPNFDNHENKRYIIPFVFKFCLVY